MIELKDTIEMMRSKDYQERFKAEYWQTRIRYEKLKYMMEKWKKGLLNFTPTCSYDMYVIQLGIMENYIKILEIRAKKENVNLILKEE